MRVCILALVNKLETRMRRIMLLPVTCLAVPYFPHYLINGTIFGKNVLEHKLCNLIFSTTFVWNIFYSKKKSAKHYRKGTYGFIQRTRYSCQTLMKVEFSRHILEKFSRNKFRENPYNGSRCSMWTDGRKDGHIWRS